jgi:hypothetical protein
MKHDSAKEDHRTDSQGHLGIQFKVGHKNVGFTDGVSSTKHGGDASVSARVSMSRKKRESIAILMNKAKEKRAERTDSYVLANQPARSRTSLSLCGGARERTNPPAPGRRCRCAAAHASDPTRPLQDVVVVVRRRTRANVVVRRRTLRFG